METSAAALFHDACRTQVVEFARTGVRFRPRFGLSGPVPGQNGDHGIGVNVPVNTFEIEYGYVTIE
jgi:hypothetical protein